MTGGLGTIAGQLQRQDVLRLLLRLPGGVRGEPEEVRGRVREEQEEVGSDVRTEARPGGPSSFRGRVMVFAVRCPAAACRKYMLVEEADRGKVVGCLICKAGILVPDPNPAPAAAPAPNTASTIGWSAAPSARRRPHRFRRRPCRWNPRSRSIRSRRKNPSYSSTRATRRCRWSRRSNCRPSRSPRRGRRPGRCASRRPPGRSPARSRNRLAAERHGEHPESPPVATGGL